MIGIYKIENKRNHKVYIGQSKNIERRWKQHLRDCKDVKNSLFFNSFYRDLRANPNDFDFSVLETIPKYNKEKLDELEIYYMHQYNSLKEGYNIQATLHQKITIEDKDTHNKKSFASILALENYLRKNNYTTARNINYAVKYAIKRKTLLFNKFFVYNEEC